MLQPTSTCVLLEDAALPEGAGMKNYIVSRIIAIGPDVNYLNNGDLGPEVIKVGGLAVYSKDMYEKIKINNISYRIVDAQHICVVIN